MLIFKKKQTGFSMIEVLISMVIIGVGLLGLSGLQIASMKGATNAHSRNVASMLAFELGERMRANPDGVEGGFYNNSDSCSTTLNQCSDEFCSPEQIARIDIQEVKCGVQKSNSEVEGGIANSLSGGTLSVSCVGGCDKPDAFHDITISWGHLKVHKDQADDSTTQSLTVSVLP